MGYTIYIFRRDLRLFDNTTLLKISKNYANIIPIFIFTPEQVSKKNIFYSNNAVQFMIESLKDLDNNLKAYQSKLHIFYGDNIEILEKITKKIKVETIACNRDYTPYARARDGKIEDFCSKKGIDFLSLEDYLLCGIDTLLKKDNTPYTVFTPFKNRGYKYSVRKVNQKKDFKNLTKYNFLFSSDYPKIENNPNLSVNGGRENALQILKNLDKFKDYNQTRNLPSINSTRLSAYIKFGLVSIREVYWKIVSLYEKENTLLAQLYWREFYFYIAYYFPEVLKGENFNRRYDTLAWNNDKKLFKKWCDGETGYPIVDAGMRELNTTGYMHNRLRLITSNFLNRMLGMDWRLGERYFATKLVDYDPSVNNGNWQWIASTGVDPKPYFQRLFNPWIQGEKFDKEALYIKKWLPELKDIPSKDLHHWESEYSKYDLKILNYTKPIVEYKKARQESIEMYRKVVNKKN